MEQAGLGFERDIRPLFRREHVNAMSFFASYEDVRTNAERPSSGSRTEACPAMRAGLPARSSAFARGSTADRLPRS
jgi:hypothetical protein